MMKYKFLEHTADIKFQAFGKSLEEVFENSFLALRDSLVEKKIKEIESREFEVSGRDLESLMYNFLEEFLYLLDSENFLSSKVLLKFDKKDFKLKVKVVGDDAKNYVIGTHIKAVTYNDMFIREEKGKFIAQIVLDV